MTRRSIEIEGFRHANPIPAAAAKRIAYTWTARPTSPGGLAPLRRFAAVCACGQHQVTSRAQAPPATKTPASTSPSDTGTFMPRANPGRRNAGKRRAFGFRAANNTPPYASTAREATATAGHRPTTDPSA